MVINMDEAKLKTLMQVEEFLKGIESLFCVVKEERYPFVQRTLTRFGYEKLGRKEKGVVLRYLERMTGLSRQQVTRLVRKFQATGTVTLGYQSPRQGFKRVFTPRDVALLAEMDERHGTLSGPATKKLMERAVKIYGEEKYAVLSGISVSHLYNLRGGKEYISKRRHWTKTRSTKAPIGERRAPRPEGSPGYLRIDSVHQGDQDGQKGVYHINAVDCVTQYQVVATCEKISEAYLIPVLKEMIEAFPFVILGIHADNGSEYINYQVAKLLKKLLIELTKSRPRHSNDNALAESKNASVVRKHLGYAHIPQVFSKEVNTFCREHLNPYVNFHRPCFFPRTVTDTKGKEKKSDRYEDMKTPFEKFKSLLCSESCLKPGVTMSQLEKIALSKTDNEAAEQMNIARDSLFQSWTERPEKRA
ncbi:integrase catalytic domain-containing protein [Leptospirillum ferrooxidans]|uniref:Putative integrase, catalytic subunit n=1 Tax=Leptospirillum ferrooxidans (strain C2-3) TaxID=1162668 RepID=I0IP21_LEPFC|nr:putative integrase, catalytic subunit [Leptospirillum ferrooxidans C2-3]